MYTGMEMHTETEMYTGMETHTEMYTGMEMYTETEMYTGCTTFLIMLVLQQLNFEKEKKRLFHWVLILDCWHESPEWSLTITPWSSWERKKMRMQLSLYNPPFTSQDFNATVTVRVIALTGQKDVTHAQDPQEIFTPCSISAGSVGWVLNHSTDQDWQVDRDSSLFITKARFFTPHCIILPHSVPSYKHSPYVPMFYLHIVW